MNARQIRQVYYYLELKFRARDPYIDITDLQRYMDMNESDVRLVIDSSIAARVLKKVFHPESAIPELKMDLNFKSLKRMI